MKMAIALYCDSPDSRDKGAIGREQKRRRYLEHGANDLSLS